jgi:hypothetical protein
MSWRNLALNREEWRKLLKKARAHAGLSSQWWWWWWYCNSCSLLFASYDKELGAWYYFNFQKRESRWEHPLNDVHRNLVKKVRSESISSAGTVYSSYYLCWETVISLKMCIVHFVMYNVCTNNYNNYICCAMHCCIWPCFSGQSNHIKYQKVYACLHEI